MALVYWSVDKFIEMIQAEVGKKLPIGLGRELNKNLASGTLLRFC